ncbi:MAG TPA: SMP-30/gluconolactonase/LRE family protein [Gemmatimonadaceae bacterium]|nr:SMP-30/gluconolactonase/LRE family protein [Gemmatimonadaceae bacterium]
MQLTSSYKRVRPTALLLAGLLAAVACRSSEQAQTDSAAAKVDSAAVSPAAAARRIAVDSGFQTPESVVWDSAASVWYVSNINGNPGAKDNNGFISRLRSDGTVDSMRFIAGRRGGAPLNAPKGMATRGNELWVSDIDAVHVFDKTTGRHIAHYDLKPRGAIFLNDVGAGPDGSIYITDTAISFGEGGPVRRGADRIFKIDPNTRAISVAFQADSALGHANGITWDATNNRFLVVPFGVNKIFAWKPGDTTATQIATGPGMFDGVEVTRDGRILVSSWADSSVSVVSGSTLSKAISNVQSPADIGLDRQSNRVAIPLFQQNRVEIWDLGGTR